MKVDMQPYNSRRQTDGQTDRRMTQFLDPATSLVTDQSIRFKM